MNSHSELWKQWQTFLSRWQIRTFAVTLIESSRALHPIIAQFLLLSQPMFSQTARNHMDAIIELLEEPQTCEVFTDFLAEEPLK